MKRIRNQSILFILGVACLLFSGSIHHNTVQSKTTTIMDIKHWNHPIRKVFEKNGMKLLKVDLINNNKYPVLYAEFEIRNRYNFYFLNEIARANSFNDYKVVYENDDIKSAEVYCDRKAKKMKKAVIHNDNNNMGYIGIGDDGYDRNSYGYEDGNKHTSLIILNHNNEDGGLERVEIDKTYRELGCGDSKEKLVKIYGKPNFIVKQSRMMDGEYVSRYCGQELRFEIYQSHVVNISLQFMNTYKF